MNWLKNKYVIYFLILLLAVSFLIFYFKPFSPAPELNIADTTALQVVNTEYGINIDSFQVFRDYIPQGANLSTVLLPFNVSPEIIHVISSGPDSVFNVKRMRAGNKFAIFLSKDSVQKPVYFVYEQNMVDYVVINLSDSIQIKKGRKEVTEKPRQISAAIESSLWNAVVNQNVNHEMALRLSDVFAWTIDFFGIQQGDSFKVVFTENYVDTQFVGFGDIEAAWFKHVGKEYYAIPFLQDNQRSFFDLDGTSLRRAFLKAPLSFSRISSHFTNSRYHPVLKYYRPHHGVDYAAPSGTPVYTIGDGTVIFCGWTGGGGKTIKIRHNSVYTTSYMHLSGYAKGINEGKRVMQGELIGYVGSTGLSTGPHLDFRVYKNGDPVDPLHIDAPPCEPVSKVNMPLFKQIADSLHKVLMKL